MTIEQEAEEIASGIIIGGFKVSTYHRALKVLKAKQDRIEELEKELVECSKVYWHITDGKLSKTNYQSVVVTSEADEFYEKLYKEDTENLEKRIEALESALKEIAKDEFISEDCLHAKTAKKALGGGACE